MRGGLGVGRGDDEDGFAVVEGLHVIGGHLPVAVHAIARLRSTQPMRVEGVEAVHGPALGEQL